MDATGWNQPDVCEAFARSVPDRHVVVQGERRVRWADFDRRAEGAAATRVDAGLDRQDPVAFYLHNSPEYLESYLGALKVSFVPVKINNRYLSGYKAPRHIVRVESVGRAPNGKADYPAAQALIIEGIPLERSGR